MTDYRLHTENEIKALSGAGGVDAETRARRFLAIPDEIYKAVVPERLPLSPEAYLARRCPACGFADPAWAQLAGPHDPLRDDAIDWTAPARLQCRQCTRVFPDEEHREDEEEVQGAFSYPFHRSDDGLRYYFTACAEELRRYRLGYRGIFDSLCTAFLRTRDEAFAQKAFALGALFAERFAQWPLLSYAPTTDVSQRNKGILVISPDQLGVSYGGWFRAWGSSYMVTEWSTALDLVRDAQAATPEAMAMMRDRVVRPALEVGVYPIWGYMLDKFHNSTTNHYRAVAAAAHLFGAELEVRDVVRDTFHLRGGDVVQDLLWGPRGMRYFIENCFDARGLYTERTTGYQAYAAQGLLIASTLLRGYSDPDGYTPGPDVRDGHRAIHDFRAERDLPGLRHPLRALIELQTSDGASYILGDCGKIEKSASEVRNILHAFEDPVLRGWQAGAVAEGLLSPVESADAEPLTYPPATDLVSQDYGLALMKSTGASRETLGLSWTPYADYHSHFDSLRLTYRASGADLFADPPTNYGSPFRDLWTDRTLAHATVSVDGLRQSESRGGCLRCATRSAAAVMLDVGNPSVYADVTEYGRRLVKVACGERPYVVDLFEIVGGTYCEQSWPGPCPDLSIEGVTMQPSGAEQPPEYGSPDWSAKAGGQRNTGNGHEVLRDVEQAVLKGEGLYRASWSLPDAVGELFVVAKAGDELTAASYPLDILVAPPKEGRLLLLKRRPDTDGRCAFLSVMQVRRGAEAPLTVSRMDVTGGVGVEVRYGHCRDSIAFSLGDGAMTFGGSETRFDGRCLLLRRRSGRLTSAQGVGGSSLTVDGRAHEPTRRPVTLEVREAFPTAGRLKVRIVSGCAADLPGRPVVFAHADGTHSRVTVARVRESGKGTAELVCDTEAARLYRQRGAVVTWAPAAVVTETQFPENVRVGSHVYTDGFVGTVTGVERSGTPLTVNGTTTNKTPRQIRLTLDSRSDGGAAAKCREFAVSSFGPGDVGVTPAEFSLQSGVK